MPLFWLMIKSEYWTEIYMLDQYIYSCLLNLYPKVLHYSDGSRGGGGGGNSTSASPHLFP